MGLKVDGVKFSSDALTERPDHAAVLGRIFTSWSLIEATVGGILGLLMKADHKAAISLLSTFRTNSSRVNAVRKVAKTILPEDDYLPFDALMKDVLSYAEKRNEIAHGLWGTHSDQPDHVYRLPLTAFVDFMVAIVPESKIGNHMAPVEKMTALKTRLSLADLEALEDLGSKLFEAVMSDFMARSESAARS